MILAFMTNGESVKKSHVLESLPVSSSLESCFGKYDDQTKSNSNGVNNLQTKTFVLNIVFITWLIISINYDIASMFTIVLMVVHVTIYKVNVIPVTMGTCCPASPVGKWLGKSSELLTDYMTQLFLGQEIWKLDFKFGRKLYFLLSSSFGMTRNNKVHPTGQLPGASLASAEICVTEQNWPQTEDICREGM
jgi:hypothetical protein